MKIYVRAIEEWGFTNIQVEIVHANSEKEVFEHYLLEYHNISECELEEFRKMYDKDGKDWALGNYDLSGSVLEIGGNC